MQEFPMQIITGRNADLRQRLTGSRPRLIVNNGVGGLL
jgi:hypothetical protein